MTWMVTDSPTALVASMVQHSPSAASPSAVITSSIASAIASRWLCAIDPPSALPCGQYPMATSWKGRTLRHGAQGKGRRRHRRQWRTRPTNLSRTCRRRLPHRRRLCAEQGAGRGRREGPREAPGRRRRLRLRRHQARPGAGDGRRRGQALRPARHPDQRRGLQQIDPVPGPRRPDLRGMDQDHRHQPHRPDAHHQGGRRR